MRRTRHSAAFLGGVIALAGAGALFAPAAEADAAVNTGTTWQVSLNGVPQTGPVHVSGSNSVPAILGDGTGAELSCPAGFASASGSVQTAPKTSPNTMIGTIDTANFGQGAAGMCNIVSSGPSHSLIAASVIKAKLTKPATLVASSSAGSVVHGMITGVTATISGPICTGTVTGSLPASYINPGGSGNGILVVDPSQLPTLHVDSAGGKTSPGASACFGALAVSNMAFFSGRFPINPPGLTIDDP